MQNLPVSRPDSRLLSTVLMTLSAPVKGEWFISGGDRKLWAFDQFGRFRNVMEHNLFVIRKRLAQTLYHFGSVGSYGGYMVDRAFERSRRYGVGRLSQKRSLIPGFTEKVGRSLKKK